MKKLIVLLISAACLFGCSSKTPQYTKYEIRVVFENGDVDTLHVNKGGGFRQPYLRHNCATFGGTNSDFACGVRYAEVVYSETIY